MGITFCALGVVIILKSKLGLSPWEVLNQGVSNTLGMTMGRANTLVGCFALLFSLKYKQPIGTGTLLNLFAFGEIFNFFNNFLNKFPIENLGYIGRVPFFLSGSVIFAYGCYMYIKEGIGCGPRDGLLVALAKRTPYPLGIVKCTIEIFALTIGYFLGGTVGFGTVIFSFIIGPLIQFFFDFNKIDIKKIHHRSLKEEITLFFSK